MKLIADSGSTKTDWCMIDRAGSRKTIQTVGINPYHMSSDAIRDVLDKELYPYLNPSSIKQVHFYGAGCSTSSKCRTVESVLGAFFTDAEIEVEHDLLGAARALCDHKPGIACILGTGSNSCYFNGRVIASNAVSLGYLLGDEGSGAYLGKQLLTDYFLKYLPEDLSLKLQEDNHLTLETTLDALYNKPRPNRFLASFSLFIHKNKDHPYCRQLLEKSFDDFIRISVSQYPGYKNLNVNFLGSVAYFFRDELEKSAIKADIRPGLILRSAIDGLANYHTMEV
jgi:N-acetylglucosamine kinase-like BadF-type ATPase